MEARAGQPIPADRRDEIMRGALDQLVVYTLLSQESKNRGIKVEEAEIDAKMQQLAAQFPTQDAFDKALKERGMTLDSLRKDARVDLSVTKLMDAETAGAARRRAISEAKEFYDKNPDRFKQDESVRASHILIRVDREGGRRHAEEGARRDRRGPEAGDGGRRLRQARAGALAGRQRRAGRRPQLLRAGTDGAGVRQGRVRAEAGPDERRGARRSSATTSSRSSTTSRRGPCRSRRPAARSSSSSTQQQKQQHADAFIAGLKKKSKIEVLI